MDIYDKNIGDITYGEYVGHSFTILLIAIVIIAVVIGIVMLYNHNRYGSSKKKWEPEGWEEIYKKMKNGR